MQNRVGKLIRIRARTVQPLQSGLRWGGTISPGIENIGEITLIAEDINTVPQEVVQPIKPAPYREVFFYRRSIQLRPPE